MKTFTLTTYLFAALAAAKNATRSNPAVALVPTKIEIPAAISHPPWLFNLQASDGTYLGQQYADAGAYLTAAPSAYAYYLVNNTLTSTSSDILAVSGDGYIVAAFVQPDVDFTPLTCRLTGGYPNIQLSCTAFGYHTFGDYDGDLLFGPRSEVSQLGATVITLTVEPYCAPCS